MGRGFHWPAAILISHIHFLKGESSGFL